MRGSALDFALRCLAEAASRDIRISAVRQRLADRLHELAAAILPRAEYVVHGELGLDHVLIDAAGNPVIIDIENLMYFDVEWEHAHMQIRLDHDEWAATVGAEDLDERRLSFYKLTQHLSLIAGPLRLLTATFRTAPSCWESSTGTEMRRSSSLPNDELALSAWESVQLGPIWALTCRRRRPPQTAGHRWSPRLMAR